MIIRLSKERITTASPHIKKKPMVVNVLNIFDKRIKVLFLLVQSTCTGYLLQFQVEVQIETIQGH